MTRLAVFDCDGTLVDGLGAVRNAMTEAFGSLGQATPAAADVRRVIGLSLPQAIAMLAPDLTARQHDAIGAAYRCAYRSARERGLVAEPLYPGIKDLLDRLRDAEWLLAVATGKSDRGLAACLETHGLYDHFSSLQTADRHPSKPHPAMLLAALAETGTSAKQAVMIGDTIFDMRLGRAAAVRTVGVAWGYHDPAELAKAGADGVAADAEELERLLHG